MAILPRGNRASEDQTPTQCRCQRGEGDAPWDSLNETSKRLFARRMEMYAGYSEIADPNRRGGRALRG